MYGNIYFRVYFLNKCKLQSSKKQENWHTNLTFIQTLNTKSLSGPVYETSRQSLDWLTFINKTKYSITSTLCQKTYSQDYQILRKYVN